MSERRAQYGKVGSRELEREFLGQVLRLAHDLGWDPALCYHTYDSRRSREGFPDLVLVDPGRKRVLWVELKVNGELLRPDQERWYEALLLSGQEAYVWRPGDVEQIVEVLRLSV